MRTLRFNKRARADIKQIFHSRSVTLEDYRATKRFLREMVDYCVGLADNPAIIGSIEPSLGRGTRRVIFKNFKIFLRYDRKRLSILRIVHARRKFPH